MELLLKTLSRLPLNALYRLSDYLLYPLFFYVVRYRRRIICKNLTQSFPDYSSRQIRQLERQFCHHFADVIVENIWSYRASKEQIKEHMVVENIELVEQLAEQKQGVIFMAGHLGNWEWLADVPLYYRNSALHHYNIYRQLKNATANRIILQMRERLSGVGSSIDKNGLVHKMVAIHQTKQLFALTLISDQKVSPRQAYHWTEFLHQDTSFVGGGEIMARKMDLAVVYMHIRQIRRGYYTMQFIPISHDATHTQVGEITETYARMLEQNILEQPHIWLWTHNRWKWKRTDH